MNDETKDLVRSMITQMSTVEILDVVNNMSFLTIDWTKQKFLWFLKCELNQEADVRHNEYLQSSIE